MKQLLLYTQCCLTTDRWVVVGYALCVVLVLPALYVVGLAGQPELFSYVEDGMFYGTYTYDFTRAVSMAGAAVVAWAWVCSVRSLSRYRARRSGIFYATLPVGWGAKFGYEAIKALVVVPALFGAAFLLNQMIWYSALVEPVGFFDSGLSVGLLTLLLWFNALFFMIGAVVRRYAWVWCVGVLVVVTGAVYLAESYQWEGLSSFQPQQLSPGILWGWIAIFVAVAARATRKMEIR